MTYIVYFISLVDNQPLFLSNNVLVTNIDEDWQICCMSAELGSILLKFITLNVDFSESIISDLFKKWHQWDKLFGNVFFSAQGLELPLGTGGTLRVLYHHAPWYCWTATYATLGSTRKQQRWVLFELHFYKTWQRVTTHDSFRCFLWRESGFTVSTRLTMSLLRLRTMRHAWCFIWFSPILLFDLKLLEI